MTRGHVPVLIVGGGGAGLTASMLLARLGVDHLLVSARPGTSDLPKAHVLNQRAMEILEDCGVADEIAERSTPAEQMAATAFYAGFAGPDPEYGRRLARLESWGAGGDNENWRAASPWRSAQPPADPPRADSEGGRREAVAGSDPLQPRALGLEQDADGVTALVRDNGTRRGVPRAQPVPARRRRRPPRRAARSASTTRGSASSPRPRRCTSAPTSPRGPATPTC